jgi:arylsulfatase A-like enzyme
MRNPHDTIESSKLWDDDQGCLTLTTCTNYDSQPTLLLRSFILRASIDQSSLRQTSKIETKRESWKSSSFWGSIRDYGLLGSAAALLLATVELVDLNVTLTPIFRSLFERLLFGSYFCLNLIEGMIIGLCLGIFVHIFLILKGIVERGLARKTPAAGHGLIAWIIVSAVAAFFLNQQPQIRGHAYEVIREAEKFESLTNILLNHERSVSYLLLMGVVMACSVLWIATRRLSFAGAVIRGIWILILAGLVAIVYYIDSRFETPLYATSVHRSMFLAGTALSMALVATLFLPKVVDHRPSKWKLPMGAVAAAIILACVVNTFVNFDKNQNLKTQLFSRTAQSKQYFKLAQWILDLDRDGYSAFLGGGDSDDRRADINPSHPEIIDDSIDNNCIGGALTAEALEDWRIEHNSLHVEPPANSRRFNVIYVFIDALRADHLSAYGYSRKTSPNLDKLAARSALFENAYTPAPNTFEALPKFTQGTYWDAHLEAWPEIMSRNGYNAVLFPRRISTLRRHVRGMKVLAPSRDGTFEGSIDSAIETLSNISSDRPFCAYLYSTDTHRPYRPHPEFQYGSSLVDLYDGEIAYLDFQLGRLFDWMETAGRMNDTVIVMMADHGESLGERGVFKHSTLLYNEQTHVPMILYVPGLPARSIKDYVSTVDLGPTILHAIGLDYPKECSGVSLLPLMQGLPFTHPPVYGEQTTQELSPFVRRDQYVSPEQKKYMVITQDGFKLIYNRDYYAFELFDLKSDPHEIHNLYDLQPQKAAELKARLGRFIDVVTVSRPWDADESQYSLGPTGEVREAK